MTFPMPMFDPLAGGGVAVLTFVAHVNTGGQSSPYTISGASIGTAASDRHVAMAIAASTSNLTSVTVAGQACTQVADADGVRDVMVWVTDAPVTSGTTADIILTFSTTIDFSVDTYTLLGATSHTSPHDTDIDISDPLSVTTNVAANGCVLGAGLGQSGNISWTGLTEQSDVADPSFQLSSAIYNNAGGSETGRAISFTGTTIRALAVASWAAA